MSKYNTKSKPQNYRVSDKLLCRSTSQKKTLKSSSSLTMKITQAVDIAIRKQLRQLTPFS